MAVPRLAPNLLQNSPLGPEEISRMTEAFELTLWKLRVADRSGSLAKAIAKRIIEITQAGESDPVLISTRAIKGLALPLAEGLRWPPPTGC